MRTADSSTALRIFQLSRSNSLFFATAAGFVFARIWRLTASCLWFDEIFSVHAARHRWSELFSFAAADIIHPPLFYALLKLWTALGGESVLWLRLLPALFGVAVIVPFVLLSRELELTRTETTAALFVLAVNGYLIKYAQEVRMYSLLLFLTTCSTWLFFALLRKQNASARILIGIGVINLLLVYTHYAGWIVVALQVVGIAWRKRQLLARAAGGFVLLVVAYAPWLYLLARNATQSAGLKQNIGWVRKPGLTDIVEYAAVLNRPFLFSQSTLDVVFNRISALLAILLLGIPLILFVRSTLQKRQRPNIDVLLLFLFGPGVVVFLASWTLPYSTWGTRHLIVTAFPYSIVLVLAIESVRRYALKTTILLVLACWLVAAGAIFLFRQPPVYIWCSWETLANTVSGAETVSAAPTQIYTFEDLVAYHLWFAFADKPRQFQISVVKGLPGLHEDPAFFLPRRFNDVSILYDLPVNQDEIWIAFRTRRWDEASPPLSNFRNAGYEVTQVESIKAQGEEAFLVKLGRK